MLNVEGLIKFATAIARSWIAQWYGWVPIPAGRLGIFLFTTASRPVLGLTQRPWLPST